jgi:HEAT repeat protein
MSLSESGSPSIEKMRAKRDIEGLVSAFRDGDPDVRMAAARALGELRDPRAIEALVIALEDRDYKISKISVDALIKIGPPVVEPLMELLRRLPSDLQMSKMPKWHSRESDAIEARHFSSYKLIVYILGEIGDARPVDLLLPALTEGDYFLSETAAKALVRIGGPAVKALISMLGGVQFVRIAAARGLGEIGDSGAIAPLIAQLNDKDREFKGIVVDALVRFGECGIEALIAALKDGDSSMRREAALALGKLGDARAVEPLFAVLNDGDSYVRDTVAKALGILGDARAVEPLIAALNDGDSHVHYAAAAALGELGDARAVEPLLDGIKHGDSNLRLGAARALGKLGDARAVEPLIAALNDGDRYVREAAEGALKELRN